MGESQTTKSDAVKMTNYLKEILTTTESQLTCAICSDLIGNPTAIACGHIFCVGCIEDWFKTRENCPICREGCPGGEKAEVMGPLKSYLSVLKPLLIAKENDDIKEVRRSMSRIILATVYPNGEGQTMKHGDGVSKGDDENEGSGESLESYLKKRLLQVQTDKEIQSLEAAIMLFKCAVAKKDYNSEEFLADMEKFPNDPLAIVNKYMTHSTLFDPEYQFTPIIRRRKIAFEWPTKRSWIQIIFIFVFGTIFYFALQTVEEDGLSNYSEPLLRAVSLLNMYIDSFGYFHQ